MAEQFASDRKAQLIEELARARSMLGNEARNVRNDLDVVSHVKHAIVREKGAWLTGAALFGAFIALVPFRRKKVVIQKGGILSSSKPSKIQETERAGIFFMLLNFLWTLVRPAATAYASQKIAEFAAGHIPQNEPRQYARR